MYSNSFTKFTLDGIKKEAENCRTFNISQQMYGRKISEKISLKKCNTFFGDATKSQFRWGIIRGLKILGHLQNLSCRLR